MKIATQLVRRVVAASFICACVAVSAFAQSSVSFAEPANGAVLSSPFKVKFEVSGMEVRPAGDMTPNTGHHHLLINAVPIKTGEVVPADATHIHFGKGQTETELTLPPGEYYLTMQFANGLHQSYGPNMSNTIKVTVK